MSDPAPAASTPVPETPVSPAPEAPKPVTEVDIPEDGGFPAPEPEPTPASTSDAPKPDGEPKADDPPRIKKSPYQARIDALTREREEAKRLADAAKKEAELYKAMAEGKAPVADDGTPAPARQEFASKEAFEAAVAAEAQRRAAAAMAQQRTTGFIKAGEAEYKDFTDRCNVVASLGAGDRPDFMEIITDPSVLPDGHKVIAQLAENPEEAARILALPPLAMAAALVKFQADNSKSAPSRPISSAPPPIKPIDAVSKGNDEPSEKDSMEEYARKYRAKQASRLQERQPSRFARH